MAGSSTCLRARSAAVQAAYTRVKSEGVFNFLAHDLTICRDHSPRLATARRWEAQQEAGGRPRSSGFPDHGARRARVCLQVARTLCSVHTGPWRALALPRLFAQTGPAEARRAGWSGSGRRHRRACPRPRRWPTLCPALTWPPPGATRCVVGVQTSIKDAIKNFVSVALPANPARRPVGPRARAHQRRGRCGSAKNGGAAGYPCICRACIPHQSSAAARSLGACPPPCPSSTPCARAGCVSTPTLAFPVWFRRLAGCGQKPRQVWTHARGDATREMNAHMRIQHAV